MKRFSEQLHKKSQTVKLRAAEKRELRERVVSYMEYHPLPKEMKTKKVIAEPKLFTEEYRTVKVSFAKIAQFAAGFAAIMLVAVPIIAERSVPGDGLYAVKRFNEEVRSTLAFNTVEKVEWETERLNRRIAEARLLASEGRLTDEAEAEVAEAVRSQSANVQKNIEVLRSKDADEATLASFALETTLAVQSAALNDEEETEENSTKTPSVLAAAVAKELKDTNAANASSTVPAFDKVMAKVELNTTRVYELRDSLVNKATKEQITEITRRIDDIERSVAEAIELRKNDDEAARALLVDSLQRTQKLIVFMTDIEVSQTVDIEEIVPVVLTKEEKQIILADLETEFVSKRALIESTLPTVEDAALVEKAEAILVEVDEVTARFSSSTEFVVGKETIETAIGLVNNILVLLELDPAPIVTPELPVIEDTASTTEETASSSEEVVDSEEVDEENTDRASTTEETFTDSTDVELPNSLIDTL